MTEEKYSKQFYVAGVKFRKDWRENIKRLEEGDVLQLIPEPTNKFDPFAIQIYSFDTMLGYVPAKTGGAKEVAQLLRDGVKLEATLIELQPDFEPWQALLIEVKEVTNA